MESFEQALEAVKEFLKTKETPTIYNVWLSGLEPVQFTGEEVVLSVSTDFVKAMADRYLDLIREGFKEVLGLEMEVSIVSRAAMEEDEAKKPVQPQKSAVPVEEEKQTFQNFIVGQDNRFAYATAQAVVANPANSYNPLFIYGSSGLGKTHLLHAIKNELAVQRPELKVLYVGSEQFTNELIAAIGMGNTEPFHEKYRSVDVLLVDDVQFIAGKEATQEEFFHTFNTLHSAHKQIVLTSDRPPKEIKSLEERLRTRFEWGITADVQPPDVETRISILNRKAQALGMELPADVADFIATRMKNDVRQLEGAVKKLFAYYQIDGIAPTIGIAQNAIRDLLAEQQPLPVTVEKIITEVSRTYSVTPEDIRSNKQSAAVSLPRQVAMYVVREVTQMTMDKIGAEFGGRDHATVVYGIKKITEKINKDPHTKEIVSDIIKNTKS